MLGVKQRVDLISINWALRIEFAFYIIVSLVVLLSRFLPNIFIKKNTLLVFACVFFLCVHVYFFIFLVVKVEALFTQVLFRSF
jgi:peptidoglycan/LPS O-acetylase OafA/YrhL